MTLALTFENTKDLLNSTLVGDDGALHFTTRTTRVPIRGRKLTTITSASGTTAGAIDWVGKTFILDSMPRKWETLRSKRSLFTTAHEWNWDNNPYTFKYHKFEKELLATPQSGDSVRFTPCEKHLLKSDHPAVLYLPSTVADDTEKMYLLMAILETEMYRQDAMAISGTNSTPQ